MNVFDRTKVISVICSRFLFPVLWLFFPLRMLIVVCCFVFCLSWVGLVDSLCVFFCLLGARGSAGNLWQPSHDAICRRSTRGPQSVHTGGRGALRTPMRGTRPATDQGRLGARRVEPNP